MITLIQHEPIPLLKDQDGVIRVGASRVTFDSVVYTFQQGATPEEIATQFDTLVLADVYAAIAYYLRHRDEVELYLQEREQKAASIRETNESRFPQENTHARLLKRRRIEAL